MNVPLRSSIVSESVDELGPLRMGQVELAAALNVSQPAVSQWLTRKRAPSPAAMERLERAWASLAFPQATIGEDSRGRHILAPATRWSSAFRPAGRFRLPLHLEWSGTSRSRWRDAIDPHDLLGAYTLVLTEGRVADMVCWVDPDLLARHLPLLALPRTHTRPWAAHLAQLGYEVAEQSREQVVSWA